MASSFSSSAATGSGNSGKPFKSLAAGEKIAMRMWEGSPGAPIDDKSLSRDYQQSFESVGYCISGRAELHLEGQTLLLEPGNSWMVPPGAKHTYKILDGPFKCLEATSAHKA